MKIRVILIFGAVMASLAAVAILCTFCWWPSQSAGLQLVARTREALRREGFKTDLSQFDFSTSPELRTREAALTALETKRSGGLPWEWPDLAETITDGSRIVVWQQDMLKWPHELRPGDGDQLTWDEFCEPLQDNRAALDAACEAALAGPIRFDLDARGGAFMRLPHLAALKSLTQATSSRAMIALHNGNLDEAWTNLLAETRLVTAWEPEPAEVSHLVRFAMTKLVFDATWQALQTNGWSAGQLARWQTEWEGVDFLRNLPETGEFKLACDMADYDFDQRRRAGAGPPVGGSGQSFGQWIQNAWQSPAAVWSEWRYRWNQAQYWRAGQYEEECDVMWYDRDRQIELRNAVQAPTWAEMRGLPGVMNRVPFKSKYGYYSIRSSSSMRQMGLAFQMAGGGLLGHAAQAESQRRILVAALALERYHAHHGAYPQTLAALVSECLKSEPVDFMDGRPLRYQLNGDGRYRLYSVGLDCVDNGGTMARAEEPSPSAIISGNSDTAPKGDIVWPFPAPAGTVAQLRRQQSADLREKSDATELAQAEAQWKHAANHQADAEKLLAAPPANLPEVSFQGRSLSEWLRNPNTAVSPRDLRGLLTLKQVFTGDEPEQVSFELPINCDALKRVGEVYLLIDTNNDDSDEGCAVQRMQCNRADDGDCLLVWHTIYESPGKHALRAGLAIHGGSPGEETIAGPPLPFVVSNLCQFSTGSEQFDPQLGAAFRLKLPEPNGQFILKCQRTNGAVIKTINGKTTNGIVNLWWDLRDEQGRRFNDNAFDSTWIITLPDSGRIQNLKGP